MSPQIKFGLIVGGIGFLLNICISVTPFGWSGGWVLAGLVGGLASFLAVRAQPLLPAGDAARAGSISGLIAGALLLLGELIAYIAIFFLLSAVAGGFEDPTTAEQVPAELAIPGLIKLGLSVIIGAITGYLVNSPSRT
jgi:hypothetical protein